MDAKEARIVHLAKELEQSIYREESLRRQLSELAGARSNVKTVIQLKRGVRNVLPIIEIIQLMDGATIVVGDS